MMLALKSGLQIAAKTGNPAGLLFRRIWYSVGKSGVLGITEYRQGRPLGGLSGGFWHVKNLKKHRGEPWRTGKGSPTWVNRVEPCWHRRSTGKDREGSWRCRRWPGSTGMEKTSYRRPVDKQFTAVLPVPHG